MLIFEHTPVTDIALPTFANRFLTSVYKYLNKDVEHMTTAGELVAAVDIATERMRGSTTLRRDILSSNVRKHLGEDSARPYEMAKSDELLLEALRDYETDVKESIARRPPNTLDKNPRSLQ